MPLIELGARSQQHTLLWMKLLQRLQETTDPSTGTSFQRELSREALLDEMQRIFFPNESDIIETDTKKSKLGWLKWMLLAAAGTIYAACDGFDGITTILALFPTIPLSFILAAGFAFAFLSVLVFYGFYLVDLSSKSDVKASEQAQLIDLRLAQAKHMARLVMVCQMKLQMCRDLEELRALSTMVVMLENLYTGLQDARDHYESQLQNPYLRMTKTITAIFLGILFFGYGFFGGQSLALTMLGLVVLSPTAAFWPVMAISVAVGLAALSVYWLVERPGLEKLVSQFFGLDENKIEQLPDKTCVEQQKKTLIEIKNAIEVSVQEKECIPPRVLAPSLIDKKELLNYQPVLFKRRAYSESDIQATIPMYSGALN